MSDVVTSVMTVFVRHERERSRDVQRRLVEAVQSLRDNARLGEEVSVTIGSHCELPWMDGGSFEMRINCNRHPDHPKGVVK